MENSRSLVGKTVVVTGASSGIGLSAAIMLAQSGAWVIGTGRDLARCARAEKAIQDACPGTQVNFLAADLSRLILVHGLAQQIQGLLRQRGCYSLDVLVNNAGTYVEKFTKTEDGLERTLAVNHFAPFLLTHELLPLLLRAPMGRVVTVSSDSHYHTHMDFKRLNAPLFYHGLLAYKASKLANVLFTVEFNRRFAGTTVRAFAIDPGLVKTEIGFKETRGLARLVWRYRLKSAISPQKPAETILFLSAEETLQDTPEPYWHDCRPKAPDAQALQPENGRRLWELSSQLCNIQPDGKEEW